MRAMKKLMRAVALVLCAALLLMGAALGEEAEGNGSIVMVTVNGKEVTQAQVEEIFYNLVSYFSQSYDVSDESMLSALQSYALELAVQYEVMEQKAVELGLHDPSPEEQAELDALVDEQWEEMKDYLEAYGYTRDALMEDAKYSFWYEKVAAYMVEGAEVTDELIETYYTSLVEQDEETYKDNIMMYEYITQYYGQESLYTPQGYRGVTHILLNVDDELMSAYQELAAKLEEQSSAMEAGETAAEGAAELVTQEMVDTAKKAILDSVQPTVDEIMAKLEGGASFDALIDEYGNDPGMANETNRTLGYSVHQDSMIWDPAFVEATFSEKMQKVGDVADPVVGSYGVHIVYYKRDVPAGPVELTDDMRAAMRETLMADAENDRFDEVMNAWMEEATIEFNEALFMDDADAVSAE